jgi:hypothetical protein
MDNDGDMDLFISSETNFFVNFGNANHWIEIKCIGAQSNHQLANQPAGICQATMWESKDNYQLPCSCGVYFYRLKTDRFLKTNKMLYLH